jgi:hypothetical protein
MKKLLVALCILGLAGTASASSLGKAMESLNDNLKVVLRMAKTGEFDFAQADEAVKACLKAVETASKETPATIAKLQDAAERESAQKKYGELMSRLKIEFGALQLAIAKKDAEATKKALQALPPTKKEGHDAFAPKDEK